MIPSKNLWKQQWDLSNGNTQSDASHPDEHTEVVDGLRVDRYAPIHCNGEIRHKMFYRVLLYTSNVPYRGSRLYRGGQIPNLRD